MAGIGVLNPLYQPDLPVTKDNENTIQCRELNMLRPVHPMLELKSA